MSIRILIADDHGVVRQGLQMFLALDRWAFSRPSPPTEVRHFDQRFNGTSITEPGKALDHDAAQSGLTVSEPLDQPQGREGAPGRR